MRFAFIALVLLALASSIIASDCISCEEMSGKPQARILSVNDDTAHTIDIYVYYENLTAPVSRQPINDSIMIIEMTNSTGLKELYKTYTDSNGSAHFDFTTWKNGCITFKVLYCPFCSPSSPECGFKACLNYSLIETDKDSADEIDVGPGSKPAPALLSEARYLPAVDQLSYCPPPPGMASTPALCLPLLIVFSLLSGALYLTGKNPWAGFNIGGARVGKHMRYQARGRGFSLDLKSVIMSVSSAVNEMQPEVDSEGKETGRRKGEATEAKWFGYSMVRDLGDVLVGTAGAGGSGKATQVSQNVSLGGGRRQRPGISGAFSKARRDVQASNVRALGGRVDKEGKPIGPGSGPVAGRAFDAGQVVGSWGTEFGLALGRIGASLWDSSFLSTVGGMFSTTLGSLSNTMESAVAGSRRETGARAIAESELFTDRYGTMCSNPSVSFAEGRSRVDDDGSMTGVRGSRYVDVSTDGLGLPAGARAVATVENTGANGESTVTIHVSSGSGDSRQLTNWRLENGVATGFERVVNPGGVEQVGINYRLGPNNTVVAAGITDYSGVDVGRAPTTQEVRRDAQGNITEVGTIVIQRSQAGEITMFDRGIPTGQPGQPGMQVGVTSTMENAVRELINNDGHSMDSIQGIQALTAANMREMTARTMESANASLERTQRVYMEQYGMVDVTDRNVLHLSGEGERNPDGTPKSDARGDCTIRVVDASYTPTGEPANRTGLTAGTTITVQNDAFTSATDANGRDILRRDQPVEGAGGTWFQTSLAGTNIVLDTNASRGSPVDASGVREHLDGFYQAANNMVQANQAYQTAVMTEVGAQLRERNPDLARALEEGGTARREGGETLERRLSEAGVDGDVARAAGLLYGGTSFGQTEVEYSAEARRGAREYDTAFMTALRTGNREGENAENMSPRAQAYYDAREEVRAQYERGGATFNPEDPRTASAIEVAMRPRIDGIDAAERQVVRNLHSDNPDTRRTAEVEAQRIGILPTGYTPPSGTSVADAAIAAYTGRRETGATEVVDTRIHDSVAPTMAAHPELVAGGDPPLGTNVARHMLGLGTELVGMSDGAVLATVQERVMRDPTIAAEDRPAAMAYASDYLDRARGVARSFDAAEHTVAREISSNPTTYMPFDSDMAYRGVMTTGAFNPRPADSPAGVAFAADYAATHPDIRPEDPAARATIDAAWRQSEEQRAPSDRVSFIATTSRDWSAAQDEARARLPPDASASDRTDYALGRFAASQVDYTARTGFNPTGMDDHTTFLGTLAGGPQDQTSRAFMDLGRGSGPVSGETPRVDYTLPVAEQVPTLDGRAFAGYVAGSRTVLEASSEYRAEIPADVYRSGTQALQQFNRGQYTESRDGFVTSTRSAEQYCEERARREMEAAGGAI